MAKVARHRTAFTVRLNQDDRELARWLGQYAHDHTMTKIVKLALYQFAGLEPPGTLAALASDAPRPAEDQAVTPDVIREILRSELSTTRLAPARRDDPGGGEGDGGGSPSGGIDMSRRARARRKRCTARIQNRPDGRGPGQAADRQHPGHGRASPGEPAALISPSDT
jgi:hypothetical protein